MQFGSVCPVDRLQGHESGWGLCWKGGRVQWLRGQEGPQTLGLVKDKNHCGYPWAARGARGKPGECGVHRSSGFKEEGRTNYV